MTSPETVPPVRRPSTDPAPGAGSRTVLYFIAYPQRMAGANRSLFELITNLPPQIRPMVAVTGEGLVADAYREAGVPCFVVEVPEAFNRYGGALLRTSAAAKAAIVLRQLLPFTLRFRRFLVEHGVDLVHVNDDDAVPGGSARAVASGRPPAG
jgi:hypothetical protein